jgi:hypothetical protein
MRNAVCLTNVRKHLILLAFVSYEAVRLWWWGGIDGVVGFGKSPKTCSIPTLASSSNARNEKELATGGRATVSETVSKLAPYIILARIRQNSLKLAHYGLTLQCRTGTRFMTCKL